MARVEIAIPRRPAYVRIVRLALASLARSSGLGEGAIEDLKIAVGEACANAVIAADDSLDDPVKIRWNDEPDRIVIEVGVVVPNGQATADTSNAVDSSGFSTQAVMSTALLETLVDECDVGETRGGLVYTRLVVNRPSGFDGGGARK